MADVHVSVVSDKSGNAVQVHNPGLTPLPVGAGQSISQVKDTAGKVISTSGQVAGVVHNNPA